MSPNQLDAIIDVELQHFDSAEQRVAFQRFRVTPMPVEQHWQYGEGSYECFVVARSSDAQLVYCASGFGPSFPWAVQRIGETDMGMDSDWYAYLYESFISGMWLGHKPIDFELKGPGDRSTT